MTIGGWENVSSYKQYLMSKGEDMGSGRVFNLSGQDAREVLANLVYFDNQISALVGLAGLAAPAFEIYKPESTNGGSINLGMALGSMRLDLTVTEKPHESGKALALGHALYDEFVRGRDWHDTSWRIYMEMQSIGCFLSTRNLTFVHGLIARISDMVPLSG